MNIRRIPIFAVCILATVFFSCAPPGDNNLPPSGPREITHALVNNDFETGDLSGWIVSGGGAIRDKNPFAYQGTYYLFGNSTPEFTAAQEVDLLTDGVTANDIDGGTVAFTVDGFRASWESSGSIDQGEFQLRFKDENRVEIATVSSGLESITPALTWVPRTFTSAVPATTRFIDVILHGYRLAGSNCDGYFDQITARSVVQ